MNSGSIVSHRNFLDESIGYESFERGLADDIDADSTHNGNNWSMYPQSPSMVYMPATASASHRNEVPIDEMVDSRSDEDEEFMDVPTLDEFVDVGSSSDDDLDTDDTRKKKSASKTKKRVLHKAAKGSERFVVKCRRNGCEDLFENSDALQYHVTSYHVKGIKKKFACHLCSKTFSSKRNLHTHMAWKHVGKKWRCHLCERLYASKASLRYHMQLEHTGQGLIKCPFSLCTHAFVHKTFLKRHINAVHTKKIVFRCTSCLFKSYYKGNLTKHLATIHGERSSAGAGRSGE